MKKKYSDPLMMSTILLTGTGSSTDSLGGSTSPDDDWGNAAKPAQPSLLITPADTPADVEETAPETDPGETGAGPVVDVPEVTSVLDSVTGDVSDDIATPEVAE